MADVVVINKVNVADEKSVKLVEENVRRLNPRAIIVKAASEVYVDDPSVIRGKRVLTIEDGPTLLHGDLKFGAGYVAARKFGASEIVSPKSCAVGSIKEVVEKNNLLSVPALGYGEKQLRELEATINNADCDGVIIATPTDLRRFITIKKPSTMVSFELNEIEGPSLKSIVKEFLSKRK